METAIAPASLAVTAPAVPQITPAAPSARVSPRDRRGLKVVDRTAKLVSVPVALTLEGRCAPQRC